MMHTRYQLAAKLADGKEVLELACGPGIGLGYLLNTSQRVVGGDYDDSLVELAKQHYGNRLEVCKLDAQNLPYENESFDVILLLEAIYYLPNANQFVSEARRVLRNNGAVLICTANCERPDFNPSPYSCKYYTARELCRILTETGFDVEVYGGYPIASPSLHGRILGRVRKFAIRHELIPKTMAWKVRLKRLVFGKLTPIPSELEVERERLDNVFPIDSNNKIDDYKVIYAIGRRAA
jgi:SAM-dependent methyltransferase